MEIESGPVTRMDQGAVGKADLDAGSSRVLVGNLSGSGDVVTRASGVQNGRREEGGNNERRGEINFFDYVVGGRGGG